MKRIEEVLLGIGSKNKIDVQGKKYFKLSKLFDISNHKGYKKSELIKNGDTPYVSRSSKNNGITNYVQNTPEIEGNVITGNVITVHSEWSAIWVPFFQDKDFITDGHISILKIKEEYQEHFNKEIALYFCTVISNSYVDYRIKTKIKRLSNTEILLPVINGKIDWGLMSTFISEKIKLYETL